MLGTSVHAKTLCIVNRAAETQDGNWEFDELLATFEVDSDSKFLVIKAKGGVVDVTSENIGPIKALNTETYVFVNREGNRVTSLGMGVVDTTHEQFLVTESIAFGKIQQNSYIGLTDLKRGLSLSCNSL